MKARWNQKFYFPDACLRTLRETQEQGVQKTLCPVLLERNIHAEKNVDQYSKGDAFEF
jgi:hypothetical protein